MIKVVTVIAVLIFIILGIYFFATKNNPNNNYQTQAPVVNLTQTPTSNNQNQPISQMPQPKTNVDWVSTLSAVAITANSAVIHTSKGDIDVQLYSSDAPKTVMNFATLAKYGYYNNLTFHRVVPGFVIQGGDPNGDGTGGVSIYGPTFNDELNPNTPSALEGYKEGVVAMANRGPNTNGSQFFIMLADDPTLPFQYTIFGKVTTGMDVVKQIAVGDKMSSIEVK